MSHWMPYSSQFSTFRVQPGSSPTTNISEPISSTPTPTPIFEPPQQVTITNPAPLFSIQQLCNDVKSVLQCVESSHEEQKKISKDLHELGTKVKTLEAVLCGNVARGKKKANKLELDAVKSEGGIVRRLVTMDGTISELLQHVSALDTTFRNPVVCCDARAPPPPVQKEYLDVSTATDEHLPPPSACLFRPMFPSNSYSPETLAPADWNSNPFVHPREYMSSLQRDSSSSASTESTVAQDYATPPEFFTAASSPATSDDPSRPVAPATAHARVPTNGPDRYSSSLFPTPSPDTPRDESFSRASDSDGAKIRSVSNFRSWAGSQVGLSGPDQNLSMASPIASPNSFSNPIPHSSANSFHNPARASMPPTFSSLSSASSSRSSSAPTHLSPTLTPRSTSLTSAPFNRTAFLPASNLTHIHPTLPSSSHSYPYAHNASMHLASPPPTPISALALARMAVLRHVNIRRVDCEGPCVDCEAQRGGHGEHQGQSTDSQERWVDQERDQSTIASSSRMCLDSDRPSGEIGSPPRSFEAGAEASARVLEAQPEGSRMRSEIPLPTFDAQDQSTVADSSRMCFDTSSGDTGPPPRSFEAGAEASPPLPAFEAQPEGYGVEPEIPLSAFEAQDQRTIADSSRMCFDASSGDIGPPPRSFEANAEASAHGLESQHERSGVEPGVPLPAFETQAPLQASSNGPSRVIDLDGLIHGCELPLWPGLGVAEMREGGEPRGTGPRWTHEFGDVNRGFRGASRDESMQLDHRPDAGASGEVELDGLHEPGCEDSGECVREEGLQTELEGGALDGALEESVKPADERSGTSLMRNGCPPEYHQEHLAGPEDSVQHEPVISEPRQPDLPCPNADHLDRRKPLHAEDSCEPTLTDSLFRDEKAVAALSEPCQPTPSDLSCPNADHLDQCDPLRVEDSRELTPADSLFRDEEAVAAVLAAATPSTESGSPPSPLSPEDLSACLHLQPELEAPCPGAKDQREDPASQEPREILDDGDHIITYGSTFSVFEDFMNAYTDGETSALRSTYTEVLAEQEPTEMCEEQEPAVTAGHQEHVESEIHTSARVSAQPEDTRPGHSSLAVAIAPPSSPLTSFSYVSSSLSPLSSLGEFLPTHEQNTRAEDEERPHKTGVELHRTESLDSDEDFGVYKARSVSVTQRKMMPRSPDPHESSALSLKGGPSASIEELSVLARRGPHKHKISELKRKLESSESASKSQSPGKKTRFHGDMDATSFSVDDATSSFTDLVRSAGDPMRRFSQPSASAEDVATLPLDNVSAPMEVDSVGASGTATISEPAQTLVTTSEMKGVEAPTNEPWVDSISSDKRVRPLSWKAKQAITQKTQTPERNKKPKSRRPQKRKSKSLAFQDEAQMCQWPARSEQEGSFQWQFVQCDNCDLWYHFGCVGFAEGDPRLEDPESVFICPSCCVSSAKRQTPRKRDGTCARPDCSHDADEFIIERLVGRKTVGEAGYLFLVKWEGYTIAQANWIPEGSIVGASKMFDRFVADATAEGIDLDAKSVVLLEEASDGGWNT